MRREVLQFSYCVGGLCFYGGKNVNVNVKTWRILSSHSPYNSSSKRCNLCLKEKFLIIYRPKLSTLNKRNELVSSSIYIYIY